MLAELNAAIVKVLAQPDVKKKINEQGAEVYSETPEQFAAFIQAESVKWGRSVIIRRQPALISSTCRAHPCEACV